MKILYVGNFTAKDSSLGYCPNANYISDTLEMMGHQVKRLNECDVLPNDILQYIEKDKFDFVLTEEARLKGDFTNDFDNGVDLVQGTFKEVMKKAKIPVVCWLTNIFWGVVRREIQISTNPIFKASVVFSTDGGHQAEFEAEGVNHVNLRQGIFEPEAFLGQPTYPTKAEIVFVGSIYDQIWPYRKRLVNWLQETYGDRFLWVGERGEVRHEALNNLLATVKIVIGDSVYSPHYWSNRIYEMIGRGGFLIHPMVPGLDKEFTPYKHFVPYFFGDFDGLKKKIDYYLEHDKEREEIKLAGFEHCREHYTYRHRVEEMLKTLKEQKIL